MPRRSRTALGMYGRPLRFSVRPAVAEARNASTTAATVGSPAEGRGAAGAAGAAAAPVRWSGRTTTPRSDVAERCPEGFQSYTMASAPAGPRRCAGPDGASARLHVATVIPAHLDAMPSPCRPIAMAAHAGPALAKA